MLVFINYRRFFFVYEHDSLVTIFQNDAGY